MHGTARHADASTRVGAAAAVGATAAPRPPCCHPPPPPSSPPTTLPRRPRTTAPPHAGFGGFGKPKPGSKARGPPPPVWVADRAACPCGSGRPYAACCEPFITGAAAAPTPEALMRSRFSAYVKCTPAAVAYIVDTTHPANPAAGGSKRPDGSPASTLAEDVRATMKRVAWQGLTVLDAGGAGGVSPDDPDAGSVSFRATFKITGQVGYRQDGGGAVGTMAETSRFVREGGKWLYTGGDVDLNGEAR